MNQQNTDLARPILALIIILTALLGVKPSPAQTLNLERMQAVADSLANAYIAADKTPGLSMAVGINGEVVFARGYGRADVEMDVAAGPETLFNIASVTKQFTAAAIMQLVEHGEIALDDPITTYLPDYPTQGHAVTVRHLLNHTSGIKSYTGIDQGHWNRKFRLDLSYAEMLDLFANEPFDFEPGERFSYNNSGYYLLGEIIQRVTGMPYAVYLEQEVLEPIGLDEMVVCDARRIIPNLAEGYHYDDGELIHAPYLSLGTFSPSTGGLCTTASDLVRWTHLLHNEQVVSATSFQQMTTPTVVASGDTVSYGYGLSLSELEGHRRIVHGGAKPGYNAYLAHYPERGLTIAILANALGAEPDDVEEALARAALGIELPDLPLTEAEAARYEGEYVLRAGSETRDLRISWDDGKLMADMAGDTSRLLHQGEHTFIVEVDNDYRFVFEASDGPAASVTLYVGGREIPGERVR